MSDSGTTDGRRARRERNRDAVVDALLELYRSGEFAPSTEQIAEAAGLSPRSLFRYFDDVDDLARVAVARQQEYLRPMMELKVSSEATLTERIEAIVRQRVQLYEGIGPVGVVARMRAPTQPILAKGLAMLREALREQIVRAFPELATTRDDRLATLDVLLSYESHQLMREDQGLSRARVVAALTQACQAVLTEESR